MMIHFAFERVLLENTGTMIWAQRDEEDGDSWWLIVTMPDGTDVPIIGSHRDVIDLVMTKIALAQASGASYILIETEPYDTDEEE